MKRLIFATVSLILVALSCSKFESGIVVSSLETISAEETVMASTSDNHVSLNDILDVISRDLPATRSADYSYELSSYVGEDSDTLMYILNLGEGDGWKIYSSDKRTPAILAEGEKGYFSLEDGNPAVAAWMSCMADDMVRVKNATDDELTFTDDEISSNKAFWPDTGIQSRLIDPDTPLIPYPSGHWEETIISSQTVVDTVVNHMLPMWHQDPPYNECCPYCIDPPTERAYAGCVAVAGAQVLYYLHYKLGLPVEMYSSGFCTGRVYDYSRGLSDLSETVWDNMSMQLQYPSNSMIPEAILIAHVGMQVNMHYNDLLVGDPFSWAIPENLKSNLFEYHGISCSHSAYDEEIVENSLLNNMPVIVSAANLLVPLDFNIHCFAIDGYRSTKTEYTHFHYYVWDVAPTEPYLPYEEYTTTSYSLPTVSQIKINWGWKSQWTNSANDGWYTLTGRWVLSDGSDYNYYRKMIYDFAVAE